MTQPSVFKLYSRLNIKVICSVFILVTFIITDNKSEKKLFKQKWPKADPNDRAQDLDISAYVNLLGDLLLVAGHLGEGLLHLLRDGLVLLLLRHQLVLQPVHLRRKDFFNKLERKFPKCFSTSFCNFITDFSANSARASACFSLAVNVLIDSL